MYRPYHLAFLLLLPLLSTAQTQPLQPMPQPQWSNTMLVGAANPAWLQQDPFAAWFAPQYAQYQPQGAALERLKEELCDVELTVFLGTWCGDSQREVPRLCRTLDALGYDTRRLRLVCLTPTKQAPNGEQAAFGIHRVPTVVVSRGGQLLGRIIERPVESLEADLLRIVTGQAYRPNYFVCELVQETLQQQGAAYVAAHAAQIADECRPLVTSPRELVGLGNVLWNANRWDEALAVFTLNAQLYPQDASVRQRLDRAHAEHPARR